MGHQAAKPPPPLPSKTEIAIAHHRGRYLRDEIDGAEFAKKVDLAYDDPSAAYNELRLNGSPPWPDVSWAPRL